MEKLEFRTHIAASKQLVWDTMLAPDTYKKWIEGSWPGSFYKGTWAENEKIAFISEDGSGTLAHIESLTPYRQVLAKHIGILGAGGVEDTESDFAKKWIAITESYAFSEENGATELVVTIHTPPDWKEMFEKGWPGALEKLKNICEALTNKRKATINSYLTFSGNCREAMTFYQSCLGGELHLQTIGESPLSDQMPPEMKEYILHSTLTTDGFVMMGSDMTPETGIVSGNAVSLMLNGNSEAEIRTAFDALAAGGTVKHALEISFWNALFGDLTDKFGNNWILNFDKNVI